MSRPSQAYEGPNEKALNLNTELRAFSIWSGRLDSNQRPHAPQACALPGCATSRNLFQVCLQKTICQTEKI